MKEQCHITGEYHIMNRLKFSFCFCEQAKGKKTILFFILFFLVFVVSEPIFSQNRRRAQNLVHMDNNRWQFGFSLAYPLANIKFVHSDYEFTDGSKEILRAGLSSYQPGVRAGMLISRRLTKHVSLRTVPSFTLSGYEIFLVRQQLSGFAPKPEKEPVTVGLIGLEFPFYVKYSALRYNNVRPYVITGSALRWNLDSNEGELLSTKAVDIAYDIGCGIEFYLPYFKFSIEIKHSLGLSNILKKDRPDLKEEQLAPTRALEKIFSRLFVISLNFE